MTKSFGSKKTTMALTMMLTISLISAYFVMVPSAAVAQTSSVSQCNGMDNVGGQAIECHYTVENNLDGSVTSSTVTLIVSSGPEMVTGSLMGAM